jgi:hypothetical protein
MRIPRKVAAAAAVAASAGLIFTGVGLGAASASSRPPTHAAVSAGISAPAKKARAGWQKDVTYTVPTGTTNLFFHYSCPSAYPIAENGSYHPVKFLLPGIAILGSFPRTDITPIHTQWGVVIGFSPGSPAGYQIIFNVYCAKG